MFCFVFFQKFRLPIGLHNSCSIIRTADGTCQKCSTKHHERGDAPQCTEKIRTRALSVSGTPCPPTCSSDERPRAAPFFLTVVIRKEREREVRLYIFIWLRKSLRFGRLLQELGRFLKIRNRELKLILHVCEIRNCELKIN